MSGISNDNKYKEFIKRTQTNLKIIEKIHSNPNIYYEVFEVTQLVNSMLGLLIFPYSEYLRTNKDGDTSVKLIDESNELQFKRLFKRCKITSSYPFWDNRNQVCEKEISFPHLIIKHIRNACAHFNVEFNGEKEITAITFTDYNKYWEDNYCRSCDKYKQSHECKLLENNFSFSITIPIKAADGTQVLKGIVDLMAETIARFYEEQNESPPHVRRQRSHSR